MHRKNWGKRRNWHRLRYHPDKCYCVTKVGCWFNLVDWTETFWYFLKSPKIDFCIQQIVANDWSPWYLIGQTLFFGQSQQKWSRLGLLGWFIIGQLIRIERWIVDLSCFDAQSFQCSANFSSLTSLCELKFALLLQLWNSWSLKQERSTIHLSMRISWPIINQPGKPNRYHFCWDCPKSYVFQ